MFGGYLLSLIVMGGASRNLVAHLLLMLRSRRAHLPKCAAALLGLVGATLAVGFCLVIASVAAFVVWYIVLIAIVIFRGADRAGRWRRGRHGVGRGGAGNCVLCRRLVRGAVGFSSCWPGGRLRDAGDDGRRPGCH